MSQHNEFVKSFPFQLIPTSIPGAYAVPAPPEDLDIYSASAETLSKHGLLLPSLADAAHPAIVETRRRFFPQHISAKSWIIPILEPQIGRTHVLKGLKRSEMAIGNDRTESNNVGYTSNNWGGGVIPGSWKDVSATWTIPAVSKPVEPGGSDGTWNSSSWIGLDGYNSNDVLQGGIEQRVNSAGSASYVAWYEWYAPITPTSPAYVYQTNITNFPINPGMSIGAMVTYNNDKTWGQVWMRDMASTNSSFSIILAPPPGAAFSGNCAEWIMEVPNGGYPASALPSFAPVTFNNAICSSDPGPSGGGTYGNPQNGNFIDIYNNSKKMTATTLGSYSVAVAFLG